MALLFALLVLAAAEAKKTGSSGSQDASPVKVTSDKTTAAEKAADQAAREKAQAEIAAAADKVAAAAEKVAAATATTHAAEVDRLRAEVARLTAELQSCQAPSKLSQFVTAHAQSSYAVISNATASTAEWVQERVGGTLRMLIVSVSFFLF